MKLNEQYRIEKQAESEEIGYAYRIFGPRNTEYGLIRNEPNPHMLFVVNLRTMNPDASIKGYKWFTDKDGELRGVR